MAEFSDPYLNRIVHRSDGAGFTAYLETYLETHSARMTRTDLAIHRKALDIIHLLIVDSERRPYTSPATPAPVDSF
jgi:hypothetical protein